MHRIVFAGLLLGVLAAASSAQADPELGAQGQLIFSADRLSPLLSYSRLRQDDNNNNSVTTSKTSLSLLWNGSAQDFYDIPRLGVDYGIAPHITIGGNLFATVPMSSKESVTDQGTTVTQDGDKTSAFGFAARAGYVMPLGPSLALWARGGLGYARVGTTSPRNQPGDSRYTSLSQLGLNLEPQLVISPGPHVGIMVGLVADIPVTGTYHTERTNNGQTTSEDFDASQLHIGLNVSLIGWL
ncbi:MAG TPA: outer membrane beta-barrel protein [Kofleriaceae bacterium]|nr:outer membrane beta-barrel protein [Kofleriaceae bacterium]